MSKKRINNRANNLAETYDYIIVGGGSAGCILAARLSEDPNLTILLLEAGEEDSNPLIGLPIGWAAIAYHKNFNWQHKVKPSVAIAGRAMDWPRGKVLGGSSSTNGMIYIRGQAQDYQHWAELGNEGWGWADVLPYFKKSEDYYLGESEHHGVGGPIHISKAESDVLGDTFIESCTQAGIPATDDFNGGDQYGVGYYDVNIKDGKRQSTSKTFLSEARKRTNLTIRCSSFVEKILFSGTTAVGVQVKVKGSPTQVMVNKEVLLCGGVINSPQLLQLSGVGPLSLLNSLDIPVVQDLPGVGENLQDHLGVMVAKEIVPNISLKSELRLHRLIYNLYLYLRYKRGIINMTAGYVGAFFKSRESLECPDMQLHFSPASGYRDENGNSVIDKSAGATSVVTPMHPESRGTVKIVSRDPQAHPEIDANYLATEKDRQDMVRAVRIQRELFDTPVMRAIVGEEIRPGAHLESEEELLEHVRQNCVTNYHPVGTCKMGADGMAVVDSQLKVIGVTNLRIVDASIMPTLISGNTNATTMMIAERAAELIHPRKGERCAELG